MYLVTERDRVSLKKTNVMCDQAKKIAVSESFHKELDHLDNIVLELSSMSDNMNLFCIV